MMRNEEEWSSFFFLSFDFGNGCGIEEKIVTVVKAAALPKGAGRLAWLAER